MVTLSEIEIFLLFVDECSCEDLPIRITCELLEAELLVLHALYFFS